MLEPALLPAEAMVVTVARGMIERGANPEINTTTMLLMIIERLTAEVDVEECDWCGNERPVAQWFEDGNAPVCGPCIAAEVDRLRADLTAIQQQRGLPKPALTKWAARTVANLAVDEWDELAGMPISERLKRLEAAPWTDRD